KQGNANSVAAPVAEKVIEQPVAKIAAAPVAAPAAPAAPAASTAHAEDKGTNAANQSIRINLDILEKMMQTVGELVLSRNQLLQLARTSANQQFLTPLQHLSHITTELQENVMKTRMQPIGNAWQKFPRLVRDLSLELGKKINLKMIGEETELDRQLLEAIKDPLTHMVRNSCDHGVETPDIRLAAGKPETGTVTLNAYHDGGYIVIDISDDGKGINVERIKEKALANGLATAAELAAMSEKQILTFIFAAGFSTAEKVTAVSGRGVGMDVVRTNIEKIGGMIDLSSTAGQGSKVSIRIPLTLAIVSVLIVESGAEAFAIPQINVREVLRVGDGSAIRMETIDDARVIRLRDALLPVISLSDILHLSAMDTSAHKAKADFIVVCSVNGMDFGVMVDRIHNIEEIVVKPVSQALKSVPLFAGNTILGDGNVIMILDPNTLAKEVGEVKLSSKRVDALANLQDAADASGSMASFLLFRYGSDTPNAVPLELVWRLEEIDVARIERAGGAPVVQYRDELMRLLILDDSFTMPAQGMVQVIVFSYDGKIIGLPVSEILDIVQVPFNLQLASQANGYLGSMVIGGQTTDLVDVAYLLSGNKEEANPVLNTGAVRKDAGKVLLVDDSPFFLKMTAPFLSSAGYHVTTVENGIEALARIEQSAEPFDIIVTDIQMPGMDGFRLAEACHTFPRSASIPVIGCSSTVDPEVLRKSRHAGMVTCVPKNNRPELLMVMAESCARMENH
ncbi:MAG: chemotaxis protein CheW, partial [Alphaproteobacteria bacterium]|nr:chemotaxis protein CheW [Alphaproteobacteria bacterium]